MKEQTREEVCLEACKDFTTEALKNGVIRDLLKEYLELSDLDELQAILPQLQGKIHDELKEEVERIESDFNKEYQTFLEKNTIDHKAERWE